MPTDTIQGSITPGNVAAALVEFDAQDRAVLIAGRERTLLTFQTTGLLASDFPPRIWEELAAWLLALVAHDPIKSSAAFVGHRVLLGSFAHELRAFAAQAGEPTGLEADLRAATSKDEERRIQTRIDDAHRAHVRELDEVALAQAAQSHATPSESVTDPASPPEEAPIDQSEPTKPDDDAWLL